MDRKKNEQLVPLARQLRKEMTKEERRLWYDFLRSYPIRFYRQKILGRYIADFYCAKAKLIIELDGSQHYEIRNRKRDALRTGYLHGYDIAVLRIPNNAVFSNYEGVCTYIDHMVQERVEARKNNPSAPDGGTSPCTGEAAGCSEDEDNPSVPDGDTSPCTGEAIRKREMKTVEIYTDGACSGNPGPGGWGAILVYNGVEKELSGGEAQTTNNRMELTAVIQALLALKESCVVELYSDSRYVIDALEKGWAWGWRRKGWIKSDKKPALNPDLWTMLLDLTRQHEMHYHWVKGHAENAYNNRCDAMAVAEREKYAKQY